MTANSHAILPEVGSTVHLLGTLITFKATAAETEGGFSLVEVATAPGAQTPPHRQRMDTEAFYVLDGVYEFYLDGIVSTRGPGSFLFVPRGVPHGFRNPGTVPARMLIINLPGGVHENFLNEAGDAVVDAGSFPAPAPPNLPRLASACARWGIEMLPAA